MRDDVSYYRHRAETELEQARQATKPEAVKAHFALANAYLERIGEPGRQLAHA